MFLDLPTIKATVSQVEHVDSNCNNASSEGKDNKDDLFGSLTRIVPEVDFDIGLVAQAELHAGEFQLRDIKKYTAVSTHYTLPTACLSFDAKANTFGAPTATAAQKNGDVKSSAVVGVVNPFAGIDRIYERMQLMMGVLAFILGCFLGL